MVTSAARPADLHRRWQSIFRPRVSRCKCGRSRQRHRYELHFLDTPESSGKTPNNGLDCPIRAGQEHRHQVESASSLLIASHAAPPGRIPECRKTAGDLRERRLSLEGQLRGKLPCLDFRYLGRQVGLKLFASVAGFGLATTVFGLSRSMALSLAALLCLGASDMVSVNILFIGASSELGACESGLAASLLGTVPAVLLGGIGTLAAAAIWPKIFHSLAGTDRMPQKPLAALR
jgi:hypothetical protein